MPLEEDAIRRVRDDVPSCFGVNQRVPVYFLLEFFYCDSTVRKHVCRG